MGQMVDFPKSRDKVKGYVMETLSTDASGSGPGEIHVRPTPPEAWEGGWKGESDKTRVSEAWPCGIVCEKLLDRALELGSGDNMSAVLVLLHGSEVGKAGHDGSQVEALKHGRGLGRDERSPRGRTGGH